MNSYKNPHFRFKIDFPENWLLSYWGNRKRKNIDLNRFQTSYDELPIEEKQEKEIFFAFGKVKGATIMSQQITSALFLRMDDYVIDLEFPKRENSVNRKIGIEKIENYQAQTLFEIDEGAEYSIHKKFYAFKVEHNIWICFAIFGDTEENFSAANSVFGGMAWF